MKKRVKISNNNPYYSNEPAVSRTMIADKGMTQNSSLGTPPSKMIDKKPGRLSGLAGFSSRSKPPKGSFGGTVPKMGTKAKSPATLKVSGHSGAHQVGLKPVKLKI